jgi:4-hydroxy-3-polyprenylbenzoate decarboxylase
MSLPIVLAMTGASGAVYGVRLLQQLADAGIATHWVASESGRVVLQQELGIHGRSPEDLTEAILGYHWQPKGAVSSPRWSPVAPQQIETRKKVVIPHRVNDFFTPIASGSYLTRGMVVCPCSGTTLSGIVHAGGKDLIQRAAEVHLKEHRKLVLVPRETPLSVFQLENLHRAAQAGAVVMPASPGWYHGVGEIIDLVDFVVARILDHLAVPHQLMRRWGSDSSGPPGSSDRMEGA